jgi:hypothetical protein
MMNKRIQKLFNEAGFHQPEMERLGIEDKFEKFALLIVQECIDIVSPYAVRMDDFDGGHPIADLKKHFGVES